VSLDADAIKANDPLRRWAWRGAIGFGGAGIGVAADTGSDYALLGNATR
jgi:hypothetical protein